MTKHYRKGIDYVAVGDTESAITSFVCGLDRGDKKCAYGIVEAAVLRGKSYTLNEDEAIEILNSNYSFLKELAKKGDTEAMVMVAQSIRYGFVDDNEDTPFMWLNRAMDKSSQWAEMVADEIEKNEETTITDEDGEMMASAAAFDLDLSSNRSINMFSEILTDKISVGFSEPLPSKGNSVKIRDPYENDKNEIVSYFDAIYIRGDIQ